MLGKSYGEISAESRSQHKSQGFGVPASRGESFEYFKTLAGDAPVNDLFDGVSAGWQRVVFSRGISESVDSLIKSFDFIHPEKNLKGLVNLYRRVSSLPLSTYRSTKLDEIKELIIQSSGLFVDATTSESFAVNMDSLRINLQVNNRLGVNAVLKRIYGSMFDTTMNLSLVKNKTESVNKMVQVNEGFGDSQPYWLKEKMMEGFYMVSDPQKIGQPDGDPVCLVIFELNIEGLPLSVSRNVKYKFTDPVKGEIYQPLVVLPSIVVNPDNKLKLTVGDNNFTGRLNIQSRTAKTVFIDNISVDRKSNLSYSPQDVVLASRNSQREITYKIVGFGDSTYTFLADTRYQGLNISQNTGIESKGNTSMKIRPKTIRQLHYDHIPNITYFEDVSVKNVRLDLKTHNKKIGYIIGAGDKVPESLEQMGYEVTLLTDKELARNDLARFDVIITGVRAHNTNEWMNQYYDKLMKFVNDGGNLIVQYNTSNNIGPVRARIGPYPFNISRTRITNEQSPVTLLKPDHEVFNFPNKISLKDFDGWIQERSVYHASDWEKEKFESVLSMNDPGEKAEDGSLIIATHGKGFFVYTGLAFFRQLPAGVPGAYRLLANIIALNQKKPF